jgi:hypothetical protein
MEVVILVSFLPQISSLVLFGIFTHYLVFHSSVLTEA